MAQNYAHTNEGVNLAVKDMNYIFEKSAKKTNKKNTQKWQQLVWSELPNYAQKAENIVKSETQRFK